MDEIEDEGENSEEGDAAADGNNDDNELLQTVVILGDGNLVWLCITPHWLVHCDN